MKSYKQLSSNERYQIYTIMKAGHSQKSIANVLGRSESIISRERKTLYMMIARLPGKNSAALADAAIEILARYRDSVKTIFLFSIIGQMWELSNKKRGQSPLNLPTP